jgi:hypothetical protein
MNDRHRKTQHDPDESDAAFVEHVSTPLRAPETLDSTFEARLMSAIEADTAPAHHNTPRQISWWKRPRTIAVSPLVGLALAAGIVALLVTGTLSYGRRERSLVATRVDTVHLVRFVFVDSTAHSVSLVGDFNGWRRTTTALEVAGAEGAWTVTVPLHAGRHEYAFIVDGTRWVADPFATTVHDDFGTESSVVTLGAAARSAL